MGSVINKHLEDGYIWNMITILVVNISKTSRPDKKAIMYKLTIVYDLSRRINREDWVKWILSHKFDIYDDPRYMTMWPGDFEEVIFSRATVGTDLYEKYKHLL